MLASRHSSGVRIEEEWAATVGVRGVYHPAVGCAVRQLVEDHAVGLVEAEVLARRIVGERQVATGVEGAAVEERAVLLRRARVGGRSGVPEVALDGGLARLPALAEENGDGDGRKDADDDDHDQELDEGEASFIPLNLVKLVEPLDEKAKHTLSSLLVCLWSAFTYVLP